jgi:hypothetical protein
VAQGLRRRTSIVSGYIHLEETVARADYSFVFSGWDIFISYPYAATLDSVARGAKVSESAYMAFIPLGYKITSSELTASCPVASPAMTDFTSPAAAEGISARRLGLFRVATVQNALVVSESETR